MTNSRTNQTDSTCTNQDGERTCMEHRDLPGSKTTGENPTTMQLPASGRRSSPPPPIILPPPWQVTVTTMTMRTKRMSRGLERRWTPMEEGGVDPMTAWHLLGGNRRRPTPTPTLGGQRHRTT